MASVGRLISKVSKALKAKDMMPLINNEQFYGNDGPITKYIIHYGKPRGKSNNIVAEVFNKVDLLKVLVKILQDGDGHE